MGLDFVQAYGGRRLEQYEPQPPLLDAPEDDEQVSAGEGPKVDLAYEASPEAWEAIDPALPIDWCPGDWAERPIRFVDGKDVGETIAWIRGPGGYPAPIRLSEIGAVSVHIEHGECRRQFYTAERVVAMVADPFPWDEVESFAAALQQEGFRLLTAYPPDGKPSYDFEVMRKAAQNRSNYEMGILEEVAVAQGPDVPTVVDGRLEPRSGGILPERSPVFGVVKTHRQNYLHPRGLQLLYDLGVGQRTPAFALPEQKLPVVSWYVRLAGANGATPNWGVVRVEAPCHWFESIGRDWSFVDRLSRTIYEYRCRERVYARAPVSLHPIVRAEGLLGATFTPASTLTSRFYRLTNL